MGSLDLWLDLCFRWLKSSSKTSLFPIKNMYDFTGKSANFYLFVQQENYEIKHRFFKVGIKVESFI